MPPSCVCMRGECVYVCTPLFSRPLLKVGTAVIFTSERRYITRGVRGWSAVGWGGWVEDEKVSVEVPSADMSIGRTVVVKLWEFFEKNIWFLLILNQKSIKLLNFFTNGFTRIRSIFIIG